MGGFFKTFWAALLAFVVANIFVSVVVLLIFAGIGASFMSESVAPVESKSVLKIDLSQQVSDNPVASPASAMELLSGVTTKRLALLDVVNAIERAATDEKIKGIYLISEGGLAMGMAVMDEVRSALVAFKESGKFIISYADYYSQGTFYVSSVADKLYVNPEGGISWSGLASVPMFFKGALDKLDVKPEVIRHGQFKAAVEPFILDKMSHENRLQTSTMLNSVWGSILGGISRSREIDSLALNSYADDLSLVTAQDAVDRRMADSTVYMNDVNKMIAQMSESGDEPKYISLANYIAQPKEAVSKVSKNKIAVIYAEGQIVDVAPSGMSSGSMIVGNKLAKKIAKVREDKQIKAVVLRVNSPGGSALASEVIWHEMELLRKEKPVIVSMGNMAASGGYYIAAPADMILASPATLTGSIGVFGLMFNGQEAFKDKLGVTFDVVKTNPSADLGANVMGVSVRPLTTLERQKMQQSVENVYSTFVGHVAEGRNMTVPAVDSIGGGRVWSGVNAREIGLIDGFGGLKDAISVAADRAGVASDFRIAIPEDEQDAFMKILNMLSSSARAEAVLEKELGGMYEQYCRLKTILSTQGVQAITPYSVEMR